MNVTTVPAARIRKAVQAQRKTARFRFLSFSYSSGRILLKGILLRINRSIQSEGAFGVVKQDYGFRQFLLRGNKKVLTEILTVAKGYDMNKLHAKIQQNRTGTQLFEKLPA